MITQAQLDAEIDTQLPDNNSNQIAPATMRGVLHDMVEYTAQGPMITRAQISSMVITADTIMLSGYAIDGDLGVGAIYTSQGATSGSILAIQDAAGTWFRLANSDEINVGWFGAKGDNVTDDSAAFMAARNAIQAFISGGREPPEMYVPSGDFIIRSSEAFWNSAFTGLAFGLIIRGDGLTSAINYRPTSSGALFNINNSMARSVIRDIYFDCNDANSDFMLINSTGDARAMDFENVWWGGTWRHVISLTSPSDSTTNSEHSYRKCYLHGDWSAFLYIPASGASDNMLNYWFHQIAYHTASPWIEAHKGGNFKITDSDVSDWFPAAPDYLFKVYGSAHSFSGTCYFKIHGLRVEQFSVNSGILYSEWNEMSLISLSAISTTFANTGPWPNSYQFNVSGAGQNPMVSWNDCTITGQVTISGVAANPGHGMFSFNSCQFTSATDPSTAVSATGSPSIHYRDCAFGQTGIADIIYDPPVTKTADFTVGSADIQLINNKAGSTCTVTFPAAFLYYGREIRITNHQAQTVVSASANIVPLAGGAAGTAILAATAGKWATLVSDGTNWVIMQGN